MGRQRPEDTDVAGGPGGPGGPGGASRAGGASRPGSGDRAAGEFRPPGPRRPGRRRAPARRPLAAFLLAGLAALAAACDTGPRVYEGRGVVREVQREYGQLVISHQEIPGLMSAMTMNFDVADPALLERAEPGQAVAFDVAYDGRSYRIVDLEVLGEPGAGAGAGSGGDGPSLEELAALGEAPSFSLADERGEPLALADLRGRAVVLDFIYTRCPGPCPVLTGILRDARRELAPELRRRTRFVSISLDPAFDTPEVLRAWAEERGLDPEGWSLLTGPEDEVRAVIERYGVGSTRLPSGEIDHLVVTFLIDPRGRIVERYVGLDVAPEEIAGDLARILS